MNTDTLSDFEALVSTSFQSDIGDGGRIDLVLISATRIPTSMAPSTDDGRPFSLLFRGPADHPFEQGVKRLVHGDEEILKIFLVPIQPDVEGPLYEAVFA